jgi:signal transduction histidine kinase
MGMPMSQTNFCPGTELVAQQTMQAAMFRDAAERSAVPSAVVQGTTYCISYVNAAFCHFVQRAPHELVGRSVATICQDAHRATSILVRMTAEHVSGLTLDLAYTGCVGSGHAVMTLVQPLDHDMTFAIQMMEPRPQRPSAAGELLSAEELKRANEQLLLSSLREQTSAEEARAAKRELEELLKRMSVLAHANVLLSSSLESKELLARITQFFVMELADCSVIQLIEHGSVEQLGVAHRDSAVAEQLSGLGLELAGDVDLRHTLELALHSRDPQLISDLQPTGGSKQPDEPSSNKAFLRAAGVRSYLAVPLEMRGELLGVLTLARDASAAGLSAMEVELVAELGRRVSIAIDNAQLYRRAQHAIELRDDVLAIVSHDLRNPLGAITMGAQRLLESAAIDDLSIVRAGLERILRSASHMRSLADELLEVASIHIGQVTLTRNVTDVAALIEDTLSMLEASATKKQLTVEKLLSDQPLLASCDREKIMRVVANLLSNAIKFTPAKGRISVLAELTGSEIQVHVRDTGPGIANAEQANLFERYWKGASTGRGSMGLGLYIARGIVHAHGGRLSVSSVLGAGSTFCFSIPVSDL